MQGRFNRCPVWLDVHFVIEGHLPQHPNSYIPQVINCVKNASYTLVVQKCHAEALHAPNRLILPAQTTRWIRQAGQRS